MIRVPLCAPLQSLEEVATAAAQRRQSAAVGSGDDGGSAVQWVLRKADESLDDIEDNPPQYAQVLYDLSTGPIGGWRVQGAVRVCMLGGEWRVVRAGKGMKGMGGGGGASTYSKQRERGVSEGPGTLSHAATAGGTPSSPLTPLSPPSTRPAPQARRPLWASPPPPRSR